MSELFVVFRVGEADYLLPASEVVQMETFSGATKVPGSAPFVVGLIQIRGQVIPVIDLRVRFGLDPTEPGLDTRVVVVHHRDRQVALLAERAREVIKLEAAELLPPPEIAAETTRGFVRSVARVDKRLLMRLDVAKVVGEETLPEEERHGAQV